MTVAEVARAADVSQGTVFNYFATKEDLFYSGMEAFETKLLDAIRTRTPGESALAAFRRVTVEGSRRLADREAAEATARAAAIVNGSAALRSRELELHARYADRLATVLAEEMNAPPDDTDARVAAGALVAAHRAVLARVRAEALAGRSGRKLAEVARREATRAFARLERGLGDYAVRR